jgi:hypothetical protein
MTRQVQEVVPSQKAPEALRQDIPEQQGLFDEQA